MQIYENNVDVLSNRMSLFWSKVEKNIEESVMDDNSEKIKFLRAKNGTDYMQYNNEDNTVRFNSSYNPEREAGIWAEQYSFEEYKNVIIMYGFGSGHFARALKDRMGENDILLIYEPNVFVFNKVLQTIDVTDIIADDRIWLACGEQGLSDMFGMVSHFVSWLNFEGLKAVSHPGYEKVFQKEYTKYVNKINECINTIKIEGNTEVHFGKDVAFNTIKNMVSMSDSYYLSDFHNVFDEDAVGIVVAAGPSLDSNIHVLHEIKDRAVIMATDTALGKLNAEGIIPDFVVTVDPNKLESLFEGVGFENIPLFCKGDCNPKVLSKHTGKKIWMNPSKFLGGLYDLLGINKDVLNSGGSVATNAFTILYMMGIKNIVLIGQDLAYKDNKTHAGELDIRVIGEEKSVQYVKGNYETIVKTRGDWVHFLRWYERTVKALQGKVRVVNATEGGAYIEGTELMTLQEVADNLCATGKSVSNVINRVFENNKREDTKFFEFINKCIDEVKLMQKKLEKGITLCNRFERKYTKIRRLNQEVISIMNDIAKVNRAISEMCVYWLVDEIVKHEDRDSIQNIYSDDEDEFISNLEMIKNTKHIFELSKEAAGSLLPEFEQTYSVLKERSQYNG